MNRRLLDPFQSVELPEVIEEYLDSGFTLCLAFNRRGTLLAAGTAEGNVVIWDFETRGVAKIIPVFTRQVSAVTWSRNGCMLAAGSLNHAVSLWNVVNGEQLGELELPGSVSGVVLHEKWPGSCLASLHDGRSYFVDFNRKTSTSLQIANDGDASSRNARPDANSYLNGNGACAVFTRSGTHAIVSHSRGYLLIINLSTMRTVDITKPPPGGRAIALELNRKGNLLLTNCADRALRLYEVSPVILARSESEAVLEQPPTGYTEEQWQGVEESRVKELLAEGKSKSSSLLLPPDLSLLTYSRAYQNTVDSSKSWSSAILSADSEYVVGGWGLKDEHYIYIWNRVYGKLEKILQGPKESITGLAWHPLRSIMLSISAVGKIYIWAKIYAENWSAFAPDFHELEENEEYVEREDEFDHKTPAVVGQQPSAVDEDEEEDVDILTVKELPVFSSDDEMDRDSCLHYLPVEILPDKETSEVNNEGPIGPEAPEVEGPAGTSVQGEEVAPNGAATLEGAADAAEGGSGRRRKARTFADGEAMSLEPKRVR